MIICPTLIVWPVFSAFRLLYFPALTMISVVEIFFRQCAPVIIHSLFKIEPAHRYVLYFGLFPLKGNYERMIIFGLFITPDYPG